VPLSSDTLFHFTHSLDNVLGILTSKFKPHFCLEDLNVLAPGSSDRTSLEVAIPMVSFCDIPLSQVAKHMRAYGRYGIGLTKEWGTRHKIAPVLYTYRGSRLANNLLMLATDIEDISPSNPRFESLRHNFYHLSCYLKPYSGVLVRPGRRTPGYRFYDEREWRFVPPLPSPLYRLALTKNEFQNAARRHRANASLAKVGPLRFRPGDVKYIIVATDKQIVPTIHKLEDGATGFGPDQTRLLISRLVSAQQILADF